MAQSILTKRVALLLISLLTVTPACLVKSSYSTEEHTEINVVLLGADPTGIADSAAPINERLSCGSHQPLYFPAGTYKFASEVNITCGRRIYAAGRGLTRILLASRTQNGFTVSTDDPVEIYGFTLASTSERLPQTAGDGIRIIGSSSRNIHSSVHDIEFRSLYNSLHLKETSRTVIEHNLFYGVQSRGLLTENPSNPDDGNHLVRGNIFGGTNGASGTYGFEFRHGGLILEENYFWPYDSALLLTLPAATNTASVQVGSNIFVGGNARSAIRLTRAPGAATNLSFLQIQNNQFGDGGDDGDGTINGMDSNHSTWLTSVQIQGNTFFFGTNGIGLKGFGHQNVLDASNNVFLSGGVGKTQAFHLGPGITNLNIAPNRYFQLTVADEVDSVQTFAPGVPTCQTFTVHGSQLTAPGITQDVSLFTQTGNIKITSVSMQTIARFASPGLTSLTATIGDRCCSPTAYLADSYNLLTVPGPSNHVDKALFTNASTTGIGLILSVTANQKLNVKPIAGTLNVSVCGVKLN